MDKQSSFSLLSRPLASWSKRAGWGACLLILSACSTVQNPSTPTASLDASATSQIAQSEGDATEQLPAELLGKFDVSQEACSTTSMSQLTIESKKLYFYYGFADVDSVVFRDNGYDIDATLFLQEGQVEVVPETVTYRIESNERGDRIQFENDWADSQPSSMVRCTELDSQSPSESRESLDASTPEKTIELAFASGESSATVSDTIRGFELHDYLVRASTDQTLTATLTSDGPALAIVIENDEYQANAVRGLPATTQENRTDSTGKSNGWLWEGTLPRDGVYRVRVAHSGPAANQGATSPYTLIVGIE